MKWIALAVRHLLKSDSHTPTDQKSQWGCVTYSPVMIDGCTIMLSFTWWIIYQVSEPTSLLCSCTLVGNTHSSNLNGHVFALWCTAACQSYETTIGIWDVVPPFLPKSKRKLLISGVKKISLFQETNYVIIIWQWGNTFRVTPPLESILPQVYVKHTFFMIPISHKVTVLSISIVHSYKLCNINVIWFESRWGKSLLEWCLHH